MNEIYDNIVNNSGTDSNRQYRVRPYTVSELFSSYKSINIPKYQRPYSWSSNNWEDLWEDILNVQKKGKTEPWFFGSLFLVKDGDFDEADLLDGQQRFTTLNIILAEILYAIKLNNFTGYLDFNEEELNAFKTEIIDRLTIKKKNEHKIEETGVRFQAEEDAKELFGEYIKLNTYLDKYSNAEIEKDIEELLNDFHTAYKANGIISLKRMENAIRFYKAKFKNLLKNENVQNFKIFNDLVYIILNNLWFIQVPLNSATNSIQIFESLNNRGKSLSLSEKIKFRMIQTIESSKESKKNKAKYSIEISERWYKIYKKLDYLNTETPLFKNEEEFFKVFSITKSRDSQLNTDIKIVKYLFSNSNTYEDIINLLNEFDTVLTVLCNIFERDKNYFKKYSGHQIGEDLFAALNELLIKGIRVSDNSRFLLFGAILLNNNTKDPVIYSKQIWHVAKIIFIEIFSDLNSNKIRTSYLQNCNEKDFSKLLPDNNSLFNNAKDFDNILFHKSNSAGQKESEYLLYFSSFIEQTSHIYSIRTAELDASSLEHFCPQSWDKNWLGVKYNQPEFDVIVDKIDNELLSNKNNSSKFVEYFSRSITNSMDLLLVDYTTTKFTMIDLIGNKLSIIEETNKKLGNRSLHFKHKKLKSSDRGMVPKFDDYKLGLDRFNENFDLKDALERSYYILTNCFNVYDVVYDELSDKCNMD